MRFVERKEKKKKERKKKEEKRQNRNLDRNGCDICLM